jgi:pimeloyl-ACP methyl ester carboxylesterase
MHIISGAGHYIWEENAAEYLAILIDWLNGGYKM